MSMMLQTLFNYLICNTACASSPVPDCPEMSPPASLAQFRVLLLEQPRSASLHPHNKIGQRLRWRIPNVHMYVGFAHPQENPQILGVGILQKQGSTPQFDVAYKQRVTIFRYPHQVCLKASYGVPAIAVVSSQARHPRSGKGV